MKESELTKATIQKQKCGYKNCAQAAVTSGFIFARRANEKNGKADFFEVFACAEHSELNEFYCNEKNDKKS